MIEMVRIATLQLSGCAGCHLSLLDALHMLPDLILDGTFDLRYSHMLMDEKELPDEVDLLIVEGGVLTTQEEEQLKRFAERAGKVFALGGCACYRGIGAQGNIVARDELLREYYDGDDTPSIDLPEHFEFFHGIDGIVDVDYSLGGCPPDSDELRDFVLSILNGKAPRVIQLKNICDECPRHRNSDSEEAPIDEPMMRLIDVVPDEERCLVDQGLICMGMATRAGCGAKCPKAGAPCYGCLGPLEARRVSPSDLAHYRKQLAAYREI